MPHYGLVPLLSSPLLSSPLLSSPLLSSPLLSSILPSFHPTLRSSSPSSRETTAAGGRASPRESGARRRGGDVSAAARRSEQPQLFRMSWTSCSGQTGDRRPEERGGERTAPGPKRRSATDGGSSPARSLYTPGSFCVAAGPRRLVNAGDGTATAVVFPSGARRRQDIPGGECAALLPPLHRWQAPVSPCHIPEQPAR